MLLTWMTYATLIAVLAGLAALALDGLALRRGLPTRFVWLAALVVGVIAPMSVIVGTRHEVLPRAPATISNATAVTAVTPRRPSVIEPRTSRLRVRVVVFLLKVDPYLGRMWLAASLVYAFLLIRAVIAIRRRRRQWQRTEIDGASVLVSSDTGPAIFGVMRPRIVLPQWALSMDSSARALMLRHELEHIDARDPVVLVFAVLVTAIFPWNAGVWAIVRRLRLAIEIDCDRRVVGTLASAAEYGELLLTVGSRRRTPFGFVASLAERHGFLEQRIKAMTPSVSRHPRVVAAALVFLALAVTTAAVRAPRPGPFVALRADSLSLAELRALLVAHQPDALTAASGINTVTVLLDANGNYVTSLAETRAVTGGGRGGRGGAQSYVIAGQLSTRERGVMVLSDSDGRAAPGGRARGNVRDGVPGGVATGAPSGASDPILPPPPGRITKSNQRREVDPVTGDTINRVRVSSLSMINGDTVLLAFRESTGETGFVKHVYITLDGPIGAGEIFGFNENVLGNLVAIQQVQSVHAHAYTAGEVAEQRLNVFVVRLKP